MTCSRSSPHKQPWELDAQHTRPSRGQAGGERWASSGSAGVAGRLAGAQGWLLTGPAQGASQEAGLLHLKSLAHSTRPEPEGWKRREARWGPSSSRKVGPRGPPQALCRWMSGHKHGCSSSPTAFLTPRKGVSGVCSSPGPCRRKGP